MLPKLQSSNGKSPMYCQMYSNPFFSKMQTLALDQERSLEQKCSEKLLHENGLWFYRENTGKTVEGSVHGARNTMVQLQLDHEFFPSGDDIHSRFPALKTKGTAFLGVYEATAGHIWSSAACAAMACIA